MIIDHNHREYKRKWSRSGSNKWNGAYYYSKEIVENIIPLVKTDRNWITVNIPPHGCDHSIVFIHNNKKPENYAWLKRYKDVILVCGVSETVKKVKDYGKAIWLPLSVDVEYVEHFKTEKTKDAAFAGRPSKRSGIQLPEGIDILENMPRGQLLAEMAKYEKIYAVGRTAIEAKILGCKVMTYDPRFPSANRWKILDNADAAKILQEKLDKIDGRTDDEV